MMHLEPMFQPSWSNHSNFHSNLYEDVQNVDFCTSSKDQEPRSPITMDGFDDVCKWLRDDDNDDQHMSMNSSDTYEFVSYDTQSSMVNDVMEIESKTGIQNLLAAHAEATWLGHEELAKVIQNCVCQKASPNGPTIERLALNLYRCGESQGGEYLNQESMRNFKIAFKAFYEIFPYGRFAHFSANSAILEAIPSHVDSVHIVDFDLCEGSQWPPVVEAIARMKKSLIITSVKLDQYQDSQFRQTKMHLCNFARSFGLNLKVQEKELTQMVMETKGCEFVVFNCMVGLPHMGRARKTTQVTGFLEVAKMILANKEGIITCGDGEEGERMKNYSDFPAFFEEKLAHYKALYESMENGIPSYLNEARIAMETLFVAPFILSKSWFQKWEEGKENAFFLKDFGLKGRSMSMESLNEGRELVKEGESRYGIRIEGENGNEMVLEWNRIPLVRVSSWMTGCR